MFKLSSQFKPAGDQPQAINKIVYGFQNNNSKITLIGVTGSGKTMTMAHVLQKINKPTLIMTHNKTLAAQLYREFSSLFPDNAVEYFISYYDYYQPEAYVPVTDTYIEKDASVNDEIDMLRLRATSSLLDRKDVIIVASVSCIYGLGSPKEYQESVVYLEIGSTIAREKLIKKLVHMQYTRNDIEFAKGTFRVRGDTLEIIPSYSSDVIRFEFFGDEIEAISKIDRITSSKKQSIKHTAIYPAKHFITSKEKLKHAIDNIREELKERVQYFKKHNKPLEAERVQQRTLYDIEMLSNMGYCNGIENYSRILGDRSIGSRPACLLDYFQEEPLVIIDESHVTIPQIRGMFNGDQKRKQTLVDFGFRLPSALDNRPLNFTEFEQLTPQTLYASATPAEYELEKSEKYVEQTIRPTGLLDPKIILHKTKGQIEHLTNNIQIRTQKNERTLITTLTKKMAEDLTDYLSDLDINVQYLHSDIDTLERVEILRDFRKGEFDVLIGINLLREGLDLPEVSLVAILDADKEGFLRSEKSLIQTMGRAARNINGTVILYADRMTNSMKNAITLTEKRRNIQREHNKKYNITPKTIQKEIVNIIERNIKVEQKKNNNLQDTIEKYRSQNFSSEKKRKEYLKKEMLEAAEKLEFEKASILRDMLYK